MLRPALLTLMLVLSSCTSISQRSQPSVSASLVPRSAQGTGSPSAGVTETALGRGTGNDWPAYDHDAGRTGIAADQRAPGRVHLAWTSAPLDAAVYAQPLFLAHHVIAATEGNTVYALEETTGAVAWRQHLGTPVRGGDLPCGNVDPSGITGTPVADVATNTLYVVAYERTGPHHQLFALNLGTGALRWQRTIDPPGLSAAVEQQRGALALANHRVYVPFGGLYGDCGPYKGAVVSAATDGSGSLASRIVPTQREAGIWNPAGVVADAQGDVWVTTGNSASQSTFDFGNALLKLSADLHIRDYFAPSGWTALNADDADLGSVGPLLLPGSRAYIAGKSGTAYLLDRNNLGHIGGALASVHACSRAFGQAIADGDLIVQPCEDSLTTMRMTESSLRVEWRNGIASGPPILAGGWLWSIGYDGTLRAFDPFSGAIRYAHRFARPVSRFVSCSAANGALFVPEGTAIHALALR